MCLLIWIFFSGERCGPWASCFNFQQFKSCFTIFNRLVSEIEIYVSKSTFLQMTSKFILCASLHSLSKWYFQWKEQETPLSCRNLLKSTTCILFMKFILFKLKMINRKWRCLNKLRSKWLNQSINRDKEELENVQLSYTLFACNNCHKNRIWAADTYKEIMNLIILSYYFVNSMAFYCNLWNGINYKLNRLSDLIIIG